MTLTIENILLVGSLLLFVSIMAGKASFRVGVPTLLFFLAVGMIAGSEHFGGISFNNPGIAQFIGIIALCFILFSGGFETDWSFVKPVFGKALILSVAGVFLTAVLVGLFVWLITDFTLWEGLLLGSIVSSTDAAAVFSLLRSKNLALKGHIRPLLEFESGSNDPMANILMLVFISLILNPADSVLSVLPLFAEQIIIGAALGIFFGIASKFVINKIHLDYEGLYPPLVITLMLMTYSVTSSTGGNGFLAVYISAIWLGNQELLHKRTIMKMFDGLAWLMQIILFLTLGLLVKPENIIPVLGIGLAISAFLIFAARPLSVYICLLPFKMKNRIRGFISWVGLRGAVPIVFATFPLMAGLEKAEMIFNIVFFISVTSVLIQGTSIPLAAKLFHVSLPSRVKQVTPADILLSEPFNNAMAEVTVSEDSPSAGKKIVDLGFPENSRIALLKRKEKYLIPGGQTVIMVGDRLIIIAGNRQMLDTIINNVCPLKADEK